MSPNPEKSLGVLTSGSDAPGMNAALRAVIRTAIYNRLAVYAFHEGYRGLVEGGDLIQKMSWSSVGSILYHGGTIIGSARCPEFLTREGRQNAAYNLVKHGIDSLVVIGGDGTLAGANLFQQEWPELLNELAEQGRISQAEAKRYPHLALIGLPASIDNDMFGTDITIGADTALHRITLAIDRITSTAASHQRTFVIEVVGPHCGYLALTSALTSGANWVITPENPPHGEKWEEKMCEVLRAGREAGRRDIIVVVAEGVKGRDGKPITGDYIRKMLEERLGEDARLTILGDVQRGGHPSAFDRYLATVLGYNAIQELLAARPGLEAQLLGLQSNRITRTPLADCVQKTLAVGEAIDAKDYEKATEMRGPSFNEAFDTFRTLIQATPSTPKPRQRKLRLALINAGSLAPGMNTVVRVAARIGLDKGHTILGIQNGFRGFLRGDIEPLDWMSVSGLASRGGSSLGTNRQMPDNRDFYSLARRIEEFDIQGLLVIGGWTGYLTVHEMLKKRDSFPGFNIPIICLPSSINNNLPGAELSVGADTALNNILEAVDKIKQSGVASRRCFVVEVMGRYCGYLALMTGLISGAERVYLHEHGVKLTDLQADLHMLKRDFEKGTRLGLVIRNEYVSTLYDAEFMVSLFEEEGKDAFDVRKAILGHLQRGGDPSPFDRVQATRLAKKSMEHLVEQASEGASDYAFIGLQGGELRLTEMEDLFRLADVEFERPKKQWWLELGPIADILDQSDPLR